MTAICDHSQRRDDVVPAPLFIKRTSHGLRDECAALTPPYAAVKLRNQTLLEAYVYTQAHTLAQSQGGGRYGRGLSSSHWQPMDRQSWGWYVLWRGRQSMRSSPITVRTTKAKTNAI